MDLIKASELAQQFEKRFAQSFSTEECHKVANYLLEPQNYEDDQITDQDYNLSRSDFIKRVQEVLPNYSLVSGMQISGELRRVQTILENINKEDFLEDLGLEDEDSQLTLTWEQIMRIWRIDNLPKLDDELTEFLKYVAMRHSANLQEIRYADWVTAFNEDYCI